MLPGSLVQALVTDISKDGVVVQMLGFFDATIDRIHLRQGGADLKIGQKVKGRVLYQHSSDPPRFALGFAQHLIDLEVRKAPMEEGMDELVPIQERFPIGTVIESAKVVKIEPERGLYLELEDSVEGFVHVCVCR